MEITISKGAGCFESPELKQFREEIINAIIKTSKDKENREKHSELNRTRADAFKYIEEEITEKNLKDEDLGQYSNYREQINNLDRVYKIRDLREEILGAISKLGKRNPRFPDK